LADFAAEFPEHPDAGQAVAMAAACWRRADQPRESNEMLAELIRGWPNLSLTAEQVLRALKRTAAGESAAVDDSRAEAEDAPLAPVLRQWVAVEGTPQRWPLALVGEVLARYGGRLPAARFDFLLQRLAGEDVTGQQTADLLVRLGPSRAGLAEQVGTFLISDAFATTAPMARESACRWAGRTGRWSMLALAADSIDEPSVTPDRTPHVDRLFAEALTRTGRSRRAMRWWALLVDGHEARDFATRLRCAETALEHGALAEAKQRVAQAEAALDAGDAASRTAREAFLQLLQGDLAVRQVDFELARRLYESVVRSPASPSRLRARAQWMIGETYFLQRQFGQAIEAYRRVEGLDAAEGYVAASLVQAGKSFEQLGRTQQAEVCYGTLLGRFADSPHATEARRRLAALPGGRGASQASSAESGSPKPDSAGDGGQRSPDAIARPTKLR
jgi:tetratricopeptide (TPR) repeat protein